MKRSPRRIGLYLLSSFITACAMSHSADTGSDAVVGDDDAGEFDATADSLPALDAAPVSDAAWADLPANDALGQDVSLDGSAVCSHDIRGQCGGTRSLSILEGTCGESYEVYLIAAYEFSGRRMRVSVERPRDVVLFVHNYDGGIVDIDDPNDRVRHVVFFSYESGPEIQFSSGGGRVESLVTGSFEDDSMRDHLDCHHPMDSDCPQVERRAFDLLDLPAELAASFGCYLLDRVIIR